VVADVLELPHRSAEFDFALSIAVIHHLSTRERRVAAISSILELLKPEGKALLYVWALEQASSRRGWDEGDEQDVMVPWVMKSKSAAKKEPKEKTFQRYYHLYKNGELEQEIGQAGGLVLENGYEKDNWWAIVDRK
jgi:tRNA (uracil-5-)-methyltransferase TRM9